MKKIILSLAFVLAFASSGFSQSNNACTNADNIQSGGIAVSSAASVRVILNTDTEKKIIICSLSFTLVGAATANTVAVQYGTGATCGTGTTVLTGGFTASTVVGSSTVIQLPPFSIKSIPAGNSVCLLATTVDAVKGVVSFVLQ